ncbi:MAG TPA: ThuA domain-containing protein, partial [Solirubrobacter sp.]|nr:ThuA domain-containing protein [Solirubrobacter sp.]
AENKRVLLYTGTTGYRHADAIDNGRPAVQLALERAGYTVDWEDCNGNGGAEGNCDHPDANPRIFSDENLARYDAVVFLNASWAWAGGNRPGPLLNEDQKQALIRYLQDGGGIAAVHNSTDMGAGKPVWDWWDGAPESVLGTTMPGHSPGSPTNNAATVQVADRNHLSTRGLADTFKIADEHYNYARNVRGDHHVLATFDERTYNTGNFKMGQDHPVSWCKLYEGKSVNDGTGTRKTYRDGRTWNTGMGHFGVRYTEQDSNLLKHIVGGIRWVAGEGKQSDCSGTVWSNFRRTILVSDVNGPMAVDVDSDGKVYWTEIGPTQGYESQGFLKMHDPKGPPGNKTTIAAIPTRADHGNSEDGVLGMSLQPGFDLDDPNKRHVFIYYSPRDPAWPTSGDNTVVGYNLISRFTLTKDGKAFEPAKGKNVDPAHPFEEAQILRVPKAKISGNPSGFPGGPRDSGPGHVGGAGLVFDSKGNLYLGVGDDVSPNAPGHNRYAPMDYRAKERWDARKTSANTADLRGKILRIKPLDKIKRNAKPGIGTTYEIPDGNLFQPGLPHTRPEIFAMGFRQPFTVHTDPKNPGSVVVGEFCHDNSRNQADRAPAGTCEWNLVDKPGFFGWPFCVGDNSAVNTMTRWDYANNVSTGQRYDCSKEDLPSDIEWAPPGQAAAPPTFQGRTTIPGPAKPATVWRKYPGNEGEQDPMDFGDLSAGGQQPVTGPVYRHRENAGPGAFPEYYDGSWLITNRGTSNGFWKEVRLRSDTNKMLRVNDWLPYNAFGEPTNSFVIPTRFGPDGALYMARWSFGCCRNQLSPESKTQLVKIEFAVGDAGCTDDQPPTTTHKLDGEQDAEGAYIGSARLTLTSTDAGCAGVDQTEYRVNGGDWTAYSEPVTFDEPGSYTVEYRATDRQGNTAEPQTATFTVRLQPGAESCDSFAKGTVWAPDTCNIALGGTVTWHFDQPDAQFPHDVWLVKPGGNPDPNGPDITQVTNGPVAPGGPPVSQKFETAGNWQFICRIHSSYSNGQWSGMTGTVSVVAPQQ